MYKCLKCGNTRKFGKMFWNRAVIVYEENEEFSRIEESRLAEIYCIDCRASTEDKMIVDENNNIIQFL